MAEENNLTDFLVNLWTKNRKHDLAVNSFIFSDLEKAIDNKDIVLKNLEYYLRNDNKEFPWIEEFHKVLNAIAKIITSPRYHIISYKEPQYVEKIIKIDNQDIIDSSKNDTYWQRDDSNNITPKKFSTSINEKDIAIYENRFVVYLIDVMLNFINENIVNIRKSARFVSQNFSEDKFNYSKADEIIALANFKQFTYVNKKKKDREMPLLNVSNTSLLKSLDKMYDIKKSLLMITFSPFYQTIKKNLSFNHGNVYATNLLVGENSYRTCYNFYFYLLAIRNEPKERDYIRKPAYYDFVIISLLNTFRELGFSFNKNRIMFKGAHHIDLQNYNVEKEGIKAHINVIKNEIHITFTVQYIEGNFHKVLNLNSKRTNKICLIMLPNVKNEHDLESVRKQYETLIDNKIENEGFIDAFVVSPRNEYNFTNSVIVSPYMENVDLSLKNVIQSSLIFVEGDSSMYSKICPICGARVDGEWEDGNCHCLECKSIWTSLLSGDNHKYQHTIWFKRIKSGK